MKTVNEKLTIKEGRIDKEGSGLSLLFTSYFFCPHLADLAESGLKARSNRRLSHANSKLTCGADF